MGCTNSKQARIDGRSSPLHHRSYSLPVCRDYHADDDVVASAITKLSSLPLHKHIQADEEAVAKTANDRALPPLETAIDELSKAKAWSEMMQKIIVRTPSATPPNEPEVINVWELMEGLEDAGSPLFAATYRSFSFNTTPTMMVDCKKPDISILNEANSPSPDDSVVSEFDPEILTSFTKAMEESPEPRKFGLVQARVKEFQQEIDARRHKSKGNEGKGKVVFYFTSIRGVRKTYEDCVTVRAILKGYGVWVDERDVSMHSGFRNELNERLGPGNSLPRVFANGKYLGGAEEVRRSHEAGELGKLLEGCEVSFQAGDTTVSCEGCGDVRFIPCDRCSGSCKVFVEEEEDEEGRYGCFQRCPECNENGLVRCQLCC